MLSLKLLNAEKVDSSVLLNQFIWSSGFGSGNCWREEGREKVTGVGAVPDSEKDTLRTGTSQ